MSLESHRYNDISDIKEQHNAPISANQKEINTDAVDNINEDKSKHVTETQFDNRFKKWLHNLTNGINIATSWLFKSIREKYDVFAHVDANDDSKITVGEYNAWKQLLQQKFEEDVKKDFVDTEQEEVKAELNAVDEQKYAALDAEANTINTTEIQPLQSDIVNTLNDYQKLLYTSAENKDSYPNWLPYYLQEWYQPRDLSWIANLW